MIKPRLPYEFHDAPTQLPPEKFGALFGARLAISLDVHDVSLDEFAEKAGISKDTLMDIVYNRPGTSMIDFFKVMYMFGRCTPNDDAFYPCNDLFAMQRINELFLAAIKKGSEKKRRKKSGGLLKKTSKRAINGNKK